MATSLSEQVRALQQRLDDATARPAPAHDPLTNHEQAVLTLVGRGLTNRQIADALTISEKTVSVHVSNVLSKLGLPAAHRPHSTPPALASFPPAN